MAASKFREPSTLTIHTGIRPLPKFLSTAGIDANASMAASRSPIAHNSNMETKCQLKELTVNPNPTLFRTRVASKPYSRGQWDTAFKATPHSPKGDVSYVRALEQTVRSDAHGFRSRRPRSLLTVLNFCRIRVNSLPSVLVGSRTGQAKTL